MATAINWSRVAWLDDALEVTWYEGSVSRLPYLWLRDNCGCNECRVAETTEKRFILTQVPVNLRPTTGLLEGDEIECPRHGARFNVRTGAATMMPAVVPVATYPVVIEDGEVLVGLPA